MKKHILGYLLLVVSTDLSVLCGRMKSGINYYRLSFVFPGSYSYHLFIA